MSRRNHRWVRHSILSDRLGITRVGWRCRVCGLVRSDEHGAVTGHATYYRAEGLAGWQRCDRVPPCVDTAENL